MTTQLYNEEEFLPLSGLQHFAFCRRQWALIHIETQWEENLRTVEGHLRTIARTTLHNGNGEEICSFFAAYPSPRAHWVFPANAM